MRSAPQAEQPPAWPSISPARTRSGRGEDFAAGLAANGQKEGGKPPGGVFISLYHLSFNRVSFCDFPLWWFWGLFLIARFS